MNRPVRVSSAVTEKTLPDPPSPSRRTYSPGPLGRSPSSSTPDAWDPSDSRSCPGRILISDTEVTSLPPWLPRSQVLHPVRRPSSVLRPRIGCRDLKMGPTHPFLTSAYRLLLPPLPVAPPLSSLPGVYPSSTPPPSGLCLLRTCPSFVSCSTLYSNVSAVCHRTVGVSSLVVGPTPFPSRLPGSLPGPCRGPVRGGLGLDDTGVRDRAT